MVKDLRKKLKALPKLEPQSLSKKELIQALSKEIVEGSAEKGYEDRGSFEGTRHKHFGKKSPGGAGGALERSKR